MENKINKVRETLHKELESEEKNHKKILSISQCLDKLIIKYHGEANKVKRN